MPLAARITDAQLCPRSQGGGVIQTGASTVYIEGLLAARVGDMCSCVDGPAKIGSGAPTVFIEGSKSARLTDTTCHQGAISKSARTVYVGDSSPGSSGTMSSAKNNSAPFVRA